MSLKTKGVYSTQGAASGVAAMGHGKSLQKRLWLVSEHDEHYVQVQPINKNLVPVGQRRLVTVYEFENEYHREPQFVVEGGGGKVRPVWQAPRPVAPEREHFPDLDEINSVEETPVAPGDPLEMQEVLELGEPEDVPAKKISAKAVSAKSAPVKDVRKPATKDQPLQTSEPKLVDVPAGTSADKPGGMSAGLSAEDDASSVDLDDEPFDDSFLEEFLAASMGDAQAEPELLTEPVPDVTPLAPPEPRPAPQASPEPELKARPEPEAKAKPAPGPKTQEKARLDVEELERMEREARSTFGLGLSHLKRGNKVRARTLFEDVAAMEGEFVAEHKHMFNEFGINLRKSGLPDVALKHYHRAVEISPNDENLRHNLARIYYELGDTESCERELLKSLEINPELRYAERFLRHLKQRGGRKKRGLFTGLIPRKGSKRT